MSDKDGLFVSNKGVDERVDRISSSSFSRDKPLNKDFLDTVEEEHLKVQAEKKRLVGDIGSMYTDFCDHFNNMYLNFSNLNKVFDKIENDVDAWYNSSVENGRFLRGDRYDKDYEFDLDLRHKRNSDNLAKVSFTAKMRLSEHYFEIDTKEEKLKDDEGYFVKKVHDFSHFVNGDFKLDVVKSYHKKVRKGLDSVEEGHVGLMVERPGEILKAHVLFKDLKKDTLADISKELFIKIVNEDPIHLKSLVKQYV